MHAGLLVILSLSCGLEGCGDLGSMPCSISLSLSLPPQPLLLILKLLWAPSLP